MPFVSHPLIRPGTLQSRAYQESILGESLGKNMLCVLPTGLGKTNVAVLLAACRLEKFPGSKVLVLAPTRPLANQNCSAFKRFLIIDPEQFQVITGMVKPSERERLYREKKLIFATPQTIHNDLLEGRISMKDFSLLVTDEAHHSVGAYSYPFVAKHYLRDADNPRILGLTASPGGTKEKIEEICKNLGIEAVEIRTEKDGDVMPYIKEKEIGWVYVELPESFLRIRKLLDSVYKSKISTLHKLGFIRGARISKKELLQLQAKLMAGLKEGHKKSLFGISPCIQAVKLEHAIGLLETQGMPVLEKYWNKLRGDKSNTSRQLAANRDVQAAMLLTRELFESGSSHPKMSRLCSIVEEQFRQNPDSRIMIFANYRESVKDIASVLENIPGAKPVTLVGQKGGVSQKQQIESIRKYESGGFNCLVTTSIGEEGLDISEATLAIFYEGVSSAIRSIQRRGRVGRAKIGRVIILITKDTRDEAYYWSSRRKERRMHQVLHAMKQGGRGTLLGFSGDR
jgi:Fanconi anemia group M protein